MDLAFLFQNLYILVPIIGVGAYIPQILSLYQNKVCSQSFTLSMWYLWVFASFVCVGYGALVLADFMFTLTSALHTAAQFLIICMVLYRRHEGLFERAYHGFLNTLQAVLLPRQVAFVSVLVLVATV